MKPKQLSRFLSLILRHRPQDHDVVLDAEGWASLAEVVAAVQRGGHPEVDAPAVREVVATVEPDKQRFSLRDDEIRANYGHSLDERIGQAVAVPPGELYHGTPEGVVATILAEGLLPMSRQYVHLTTSLDIARRVGGRRGRPVLLRVDAAAAHAAGVVFYRANETFWLVDRLGPEFLRRT
ncbi:MAG TPA: RNA--NAD 2'-phosphotransferase [Planctomycetes bacterium]|nr:RNA--NAD 2'-phosphotransferase [Planctomycetota bacterium]